MSNILLSMVTIPLMFWHWVIKDPNHLVGFVLRRQTTEMDGLGFYYHCRSVFNTYIFMVNISRTVLDVDIDYIYCLLTGGE